LIGSTGWNKKRIAPVEEPFSAQEQKLIDWRLCQFLNMGVPREDAENLAERFEVSYQLVRRLVEDGCDPLTAVRIAA
jgi:hypothetical protein